GRGVGSLMGGFLMGPIGVRNTFRLMGVICAVTCILYFVINRIFFRKLQLEREEKEKTEANENHTMEKNQNGIVENGTMKHKSNEEVKDAVKGKESDARVVNSGKGTYNEAFEKNE
ncbi:hypothetical protein OTU49_005674, partial [Cherax quadricarinatus]